MKSHDATKTIITKGEATMISVFVCENNFQYLKSITECIEKLIIIEELDIKLEIATSNPAEVIEFIANKKVDGLYFLDIELDDGKSGIDVARAVREHDPNGTIVFITSHLQYRELTFKYNVEALDYIQKGNEDEVNERIKACVERAMRKYIDRNEGLHYCFKLPKGRTITCKHEDILFFETDPSVPHRIILHTKRMQYVFYQSLDKVREELPKNNFFKSHRSYIINLNNLTETCKTELMQGNPAITMPNGAECKVSASNRKVLLKFMAITMPSGGGGTAAFRR
ncbi:MAG: LytTR family DNA-binding domain-containing protein [Defluviitaleaceae bacterium]|nr:LytTR family DNA-binding domain-containing protein [Defluviitaleaceae bacterium]